MKNIFIYGSGRSGTSMLAGLFSEAGYHMGEALYPGRDTNPKGFFESAEINGLNERLIAHNIPKPFLLKNYNQKLKESQRWLASFPLDKKFKTTKAFNERIAQECDKAPFCYKDPRFTYTYPLWEPLAGDHVCLIIFRSPGKTIASIQKEIKSQPYLKGCSTAESRLMELWCNLYERIIKRDSDTAMFIHYDQAFDDKKTAAIQEFCDLDSITPFAEKRLARTQEPSFKLSDRAKRIYEQLNRLAQYTTE